MTIPLAIIKHHYEKIGEDRVTHAIELEATPNEADNQIYWVNFRCWQVAAHKDGKPEFMNCGEWDSFTTDPTKTTPAWTGHVKWDGCHEFHFEDTHGCGGLGDLEIRHAAERRCMELAHALLTSPDWNCTP